MQRFGEILLAGDRGAGIGHGRTPAGFVGGCFWDIFRRPKQAPV
jgi:hypothetical protein